MRILCIGDVFGEGGRRILRRHLAELVERYRTDFLLVNGENAAGGRGITPDIAEDFWRLGVDVITLGNHTWDKREILPLLGRSDRLLRPYNLPPDTPGRGLTVVERRGVRVAVLSLHGRVFAHNHPDCPFRAADAALEELAGRASVVLVDMHAEATSEKAALGHYLDGRVAAVLGTHTHVQTADERILPRGTAFMTDLGMTGPIHSVIGVEPRIAIERFLTQRPNKFEPARGPAQLAGAVIDVEESTGRARDITRILIREPDGQNP